MKRVQHVGTVIEVQGEKAVVQLEAAPDCGGGFQCACSASVATEPRKITVHRGELEEGDKVSVSMLACTGYLSTLLIFVLPIVGFTVGMAVGTRFEATPGTHDMPTIVGGFVGLGVAVGVALLVNRWLSHPSHMEVLRLTKGQAD